MKQVKVIMVLFLICLVIGCENKQSNKQIEKINSEIGKESDVYFCPRDDCEKLLVNFLNSSTRTIHCAFYDLNLEGVIKILNEKKDEVDVGIAVDYRNIEELGNASFVFPIKKSSLMHDKFCVVDSEKIFAGSFNPTINDAKKNNNNAVFIYSKYLAKNYEDEYNEIINGKSSNTAYKKMVYNGKIIENLFCPEDLCAKRLKEVLGGAQKEIVFMTFSFTDNGVGNQLILAKQRGVYVSGVIENRNIKGSVYNLLCYQDVPARIDANKYTMHHKVFVIDNTTVVTGSYNPTENGNKRNDENVLIIHDPAIVKKFREEYEVVFNGTKSCS